MPAAPNRPEQAVEPPRANIFYVEIGEFDEATFMAEARRLLTDVNSAAQRYEKQQNNCGSVVSGILQRNGVATFPRPGAITGQIYEYGGDHRPIGLKEPQGGPHEHQSQTRNDDINLRLGLVGVLISNIDRIVVTCAIASLRRNLHDGPANGGFVGHDATRRAEMSLSVLKTFGREADGLNEIHRALMSGQLNTVYRVYDILYCRTDDPIERDLATIKQVLILCSRLRTQNVSPEFIDNMSFMLSTYDWAELRRVFEGLEKIGLDVDIVVKKTTKESDE